VTSETLMGEYIEDQQAGALPDGDGQRALILLLSDYRRLCRAEFRDVW
jgi:hypothetical protein